MGGRYKPGNGMFSALLDIVYILFIVTGLFKRVIDNGNQDPMFAVIVPVGLIVAGIFCGVGGKILYRRLIEKYGEARAESIDHNVQWITIAVFLAVSGITFKKFGIW